MEHPNRILFSNCAITPFLLQFLFLSPGQTDKGINILVSSGPKRWLLPEEQYFLFITQWGIIHLISPLEITTSYKGCDESPKYRSYCKKQWPENIIKRYLDHLRILSTHWAFFKAVLSKVLHTNKKTLSKVLLSIVQISVV